MRSFKSQFMLNDNFSQYELDFGNFICVGYNQLQCGFIQRLLKCYYCLWVADLLQWHPEQIF